MSATPHSTLRTPHYPRRGLLLVIVLLVVALLSLAGYGFVEMMVVEHKTAKVYAEAAATDQLVASGAAIVQAVLERPRAWRQQAGGTRDNPTLFRAAAVGSREKDARPGLASVFVPSEEADQPGVRFGLEDESSRLNLAVLAEWDAAQNGAGRRALLALPAMTESIADAILDWLDADSVPRQFGAEADYYRGLDPPYLPRNGPPETLEELLLIKGVTRKRLLGQSDENARDGFADGERLGPRSPPVANAPRIMGAGGDRPVAWMHLLTLRSAERNESSRGQPRIDLNDGDLARLHARLATVFPAEWANYAVAYRQYGPYAGAPSGPATQMIPLDLALPPRFKIASLIDLVDSQVRFTRGGVSLVVASPLQSNGSNAQEDLARLVDRAAVDSRPVIAGRVNIDEAPREVLLAVPGIDRALAERIVVQRPLRVGSIDIELRQPTWLLADKLVDLLRMKALLPYVTCGGDVARAQVVGRVEGTSRASRAEIVIDAARRPARQIALRVLHGLPDGITREQLGEAPNDTQPPAAATMRRADRVGSARSEY